MASTRLLVAELVRLAGAGEHVLPDLELMVSELVTNAIEHGKAPVRASVHVTPQWVRVDVFDSGTHLPVLDALPPPDQERGRGLLIVEALADHVGVRLDPSGGKAVWFERAVL